MAVTNVVDSDALDARLFAAALHLPMQVVLADRENTAVLRCAVELLQIILNFLAKNCGILMTRLLLGVLGVVITSCPLRR